MRGTLTALLVLAAAATAQNYKCDWSVNGIGGGSMAGGYGCSSTIGQTTAGQMTGASYWALIGFWQPGIPTGVREQTNLASPGSLETHLCSPFPNPAVRSVTVRYSLAAEGPISLRVHDLTGRVVRTLCASSTKRGMYSVAWDGTDDRGRELARGVYFCRFTAGDYRATEKLVLQR
jgi:hypothetical protein